jgi:hypothetical protein
MPPTARYRPNPSTARKPSGLAPLQSAGPVADVQPAGARPARRESDKGDARIDPPTTSPGLLIRCSLRPPTQPTAARTPRKVGEILARWDASERTFAGSIRSPDAPPRAGSGSVLCRRSARLPDADPATEAIVSARDRWQLNAAARARQRRAAAPRLRGHGGPVAASLQVRWGKRRRRGCRSVACSSREAAAS